MQLDMMKQDLSNYRGGGALSPRPLTGNSKSNAINRRSDDFHENAIVIRGSASDLKQLAARTNRA